MITYRNKRSLTLAEVDSGEESYIDDVDDDNYRSKCSDISCEDGPYGEDQEGTDDDLMRGRHGYVSPHCQGKYRQFVITF